MDSSPSGSSVHGGFSWQEYWSGLSCPPPGDLPDPGIEPESLKSPALVGKLFTTSVRPFPDISKFLLGSHFFIKEDKDFFFFPISLCCLEIEVGVWN